MTMIPQTDLSEWRSHGVGKDPVVATVIRCLSRGANCGRYVADLAGITFVTITPNGVPAILPWQKMMKHRPICHMCRVYRQFVRPFFRFVAYLSKNS